MTEDSTTQQPRHDHQLEPVVSNTFSGSYVDLQTSQSKYAPEGGYGWVCVAATVLINAHTWGVNSAYGVFLSFYLSDNTFQGTSALEYAFVGSLSIAIAMLVSPLATHMTHHLGVRLVVATGTIFEAGSFIATSFVHKSWQLMLSQGICFGLGMGLIFVSSVGVISHWFEKRRSLVNGIAAGGSGIGGLIYSLAVATMIPRLGLPWAMRVLGIICLVVNTIGGLLLRLPHRDNAARKQPPMRLSIFRNPAYVSLLAWGIMSSMGYVGLLFSLSSYGVAVGLSQHQASIASALLNLGQAFGRPLFGFISDAIDRVNMAIAATLFTGVFCFVAWIFAHSMGVVCFFAIVVGLTAGTMWAAAGPIASEVVGLSELHGALGFFWFSIGAPMAVAEPIAVQLRGGTTSSKPYLRVQVFIGSMYIGASLCLVVLKIFAQRSRVLSKTG